IPSGLTGRVSRTFTRPRRATSRPRSATPKVPTSPTRSSTTPVSGFARLRRPCTPVSRPPARISRTSTFC
ncbi:hypothetical protein BG004_008259, partial [Podila humilis]